MLPDHPLGLDVPVLGVIPYREAWVLQMQAHERCRQGESLGALLCLEHPPTITLGKHGQWGFVHTPADRLAALGIEVIRTDRGGEVTAHEPGQLVLYPILPLSRWGISPKQYVQALHMWIVVCLERMFGIRAHIDPEFPGVWVGTRKICAVGIRIKDRVSLHGLALNVHNSLSTFQHMTPCGIAHRGVTSVRVETHQVQDMGLVKKRLQDSFQGEFAGYVRGTQPREYSQP